MLFTLPSSSVNRTMGIKDSAKRLVYKRPKGRYLLDLPVEVLSQVCSYLPLHDKKRYRLVCSKTQLAGGIDMWQNVMIDIASCSGTNGAFEKERDYSEFKGVKEGSPLRQCWIAIRRRRDFYDLVSALMQGECVTYLQNATTTLSIRVSGTTFGFGSKPPLAFEDLDKTIYTSQGLWLIEQAIPQYCLILERLEVLTSTYDGTVQYIYPLMGLLSQFPFVRKSISSQAYLKLMNKDPLIENVERYRVTTKKFTPDLSMPSSVRRLDLTVTNPDNPHQPSPVGAATFARFLHQLLNLEELSLDGLVVECGNEDHWIPDTIHTLEFVLQDQFIHTSFVTFPFIRRLKLHMEGEFMNDPFLLMHFPSLESLYIRELPSLTRPQIKIPNTLVNVRELQLDISYGTYTYLPRLLSHFSSRKIERLILSGTFACQEFLNGQTSNDVQTQFRKCLDKLTNLRSLVLHGGPEDVANVAIARTFLELPAIEEIILYPADIWTRSPTALAGFMKRVVVQLGCKNVERDDPDTVDAFCVDASLARELGERDWIPRPVYDLQGNHRPPSSNANANANGFHSHHETPAVVTPI